jgi:restriction system protein
MTIPNYQAIMPVLLQHIADCDEHSNRQITEAMADHFGLSEEERTRLLPSGNQKIFTNRVAWAKAELKMAGLIESPRRGISVITQSGLDVVRQNLPERMDRNFLKQFPGYREKLGGGTKKPDTEQNHGPPENPPQEVLEEAYQNLKRELSSELLSQIKVCSPGFFERIVIDLLVRLGYGGSLHDAGRSIGKSGDEGVDGIIKEDRLGLDIIYVQAKKWENTVSRPEIQKFAGALQGKRARKGVFITTSEFSQGAREYASGIETNIVLIDGNELTGLMIDYGVGVSTTGVYEVKKVDYDYFEDV